MIGQIINFRYEVLEKIGEGEISSVFKSRDKVLNRLVALKVFNKDICDNKQFCDSACDGYQRAASLIFPSIARVFDADYTISTPFIATEYVRGINIKERVKRIGAMPVPLVLDIIVPVLEALEYAHSNKVIHGDLRSNDIILSPDGEVKITDFGISDGLQAAPEIADKYNMRSVHYQAPEIVEGSTPTASSDIYSVGVILYELLAGALPFDGATAVAVALKKTKDSPVAPRLVNTAIPKSLNDVIMMALERNPENRYRDVSSMLADLISIRDSLRVGKPISIRRPATAAPVQNIEQDGSAQDYVPEGNFKKSFLLLGLLFIGIVLATLFATMFIAGRKIKIEVPDFRGVTFEQAQEIARQKKFEVVDDGRGYSDSYEAGMVCQQSPFAGERVYKSDNVIRVKISDGPSSVPVPELAGLPENEAHKRAVSQGFLIGSVKQQYSETVPTGSIISQDPLAGTRKSPQSTIDIVVSQGPKPADESTDGVTDTGGSQPSNPDQPSAGSQERDFDVDFEVPESVPAPQKVKILVFDDNGTNTVYDELHEPGDKSTITVSGVGDSVRIRVYIAGKLVKEYKE